MTPNPHRTLGARLREARIAAGYSQQEMADRLGLLRPCVSLMESGARKVSALELARMAYLYGFSPDHFLRDLAQLPPARSDNQS